MTIKQTDRGFLYDGKAITRIMKGVVMSVLFDMGMYSNQRHLWIAGRKLTRQAVAVLIIQLQYWLDHGTLDEEKSDETRPSV